MIPTFVKLAATSDPAQELERYERFGLSPLSFGVNGGRHFTLVSLETFMERRDPQVIAARLVLDLPESIEHWPSALRLLQGERHWFRTSARTARENHSAFETIPRGIAERMLLTGEAAEKIPLFPPWREISHMDLPTPHPLPCASVENRPWLSVILLEAVSIKEAAKNLAKAGIHSSACEFLTYSARDGLRTSTHRCEVAAGFEFAGGRERSLLLNFAAHYARGDQLLIVEDTSALENLNGNLLINESQRQQMILFEGATLVYLGAFKKMGGFAPAARTYADSLTELAARLNWVSFGVIRVTVSGEVKRVKMDKSECLRHLWNFK